jgi:GT2 family glycosyltransferase
VSIIDVIVPVYEGYEEVCRCLESVLGSANKVAHRCVVIDDCSPNAEIKRYLQELATTGRIELFSNEQNLGFVKTVNRGMHLSSNHDVVLLNSDTVVANDWLDRLLCTAQADPATGTVTPLSNNAEICSFPRLCHDNALPQGYSTEQVDAVLATSLAGTFIEIPTAVGFCMYIKRACLDDVGYFDADLFKLGYGEENDFCLRARARGWKNVLAADCFVYHAGGVSFSDRKQQLVNNAMQILDRKYPSYHAEIADFIRADPPYALRCKGLIDLLHTDPRQKVLAVTHQLGGGTEKHVRELADCTDARSAMLLLRPYRGSVVRLTLGVDADMPVLNFDWADAAAQAALLQLLRHLGVARLHIHHVMGLEDILPALLAALALPYDVTLHDYFLIDGNPTLTDTSGMFQPERALRGGGSNSTWAFDSERSWNEWRDRQQQMLAAAERVFVPSHAALRLYQACYELPAATVSWHADMLGVETLPVQLSAAPLADRPLRILVLGALGVEKGADLLEAVAELAQSTSCELEFTLLGYAYRPLAGPVETLGPYGDAEIDNLIEAQQPDLLWFPCRWPETYSYTLSAALRAGRPLLVPDIGSFPERVAERPMTWIMAWDSSPADYLEQLQTIRGELTSLPATTQWQWRLPAAAPFRYDDDYCLPHAPPVVAEGFSFEDVLRYLPGPEEKIRQGRRIRLLALLMRMKNHRALAWLSRLIPYRVQRAIKRRLSRQALHDLLP